MAEASVNAEAENLESLDDENMKNVMENYVILKTIFQFLPIKVLNKVSRVSSLWASVGETVKHQRRSTVKHISYSESLFTKFLKLSIDHQVSEQIENLMFEPQLAFVHCSRRLYQDGVTTKPDGTKLPLVQYLTEKLPSACYIVGTVTDGVVGPLSTGAVEEMESRGGQGFVCVLFPKFPSVNIHPFVITEQVATQLLDLFEDSKTCNFLSCLGLPTDYPPLCIFTFHQCSSDIALEYDMGNHFKMHHNYAMCAGALVDDFIIDPRLKDVDRREEVVIHGLMFCGSEESLKCSSLLVDAQKKPKMLKAMEEWQMKMEPKLLQNPKSMQNIAFMFSCIGRGRHLYKGNPNIESSKFTLLFPNINLSGLFGNGEIGENYDADMMTPGSRKSCPAQKNLRHSYTSVLTLMSIDYVNHLEPPEWYHSLAEADIETLPPRSEVSSDEDGLGVNSEEEGYYDEENDSDTMSITPADNAAMDDVSDSEELNESDQAMTSNESSPANKAASMNETTQNNSMNSPQPSCSSVSQTETGCHSNDISGQSMSGYESAKRLQPQEAEVKDSKKSRLDT